MSSAPTVQSAREDVPLPAEHSLSMVSPPPPMVHCLLVKCPPEEPCSMLRQCSSQTQEHQKPTQQSCCAGRTASSCGGSGHCGLPQSGLCLAPVPLFEAKALLLLGASLEGGSCVLSGWICSMRKAISRATAPGQLLMETAGQDPAGEPHRGCFHTMPCVLRPFVLWGWHRAGSSPGMPGLSRSTH